MKINELMMSIHRKDFNMEKEEVEGFEIIDLINIFE